MTRVPRKFFVSSGGDQDGLVELYPSVPHPRARTPPFKSNDRTLGATRTAEVRTVDETQAKTVRTNEGDDGSGEPAPTPPGAVPTPSSHASSRPRGCCSEPPRGGQERPPSPSVSFLEARGPCRSPRRKRRCLRESATARFSGRATPTSCLGPRRGPAQSVESRQRRRRASPAPEQAGTDAAGREGEGDAEAATSSSSREGGGTHARDIHSEGF